MPRVSRVLILTALACMAGMTHAQTVYRCGNSYTQKPCVEGTAIDVDDSRTPNQKASTDAAVARDSKTAAAMEQARLKEEAKPTPVNYPPPKPQVVEPTPEKPKLKKGKKQLEIFTASVPGEKKKKVAEKKAVKSKPDKSSPTG